MNLCLGPRFDDYLNGLQEEFEFLSNSTPMNRRPNRFNLYLGGLKGEFELMTLEIESLRKERYEYIEKVEKQAKELQDVRTSFICERCSKGNHEPQVVASKFSKTASLFSRPFFQFKFLSKPTTSLVGLTQRSLLFTREFAITLIEKLHSTITPTQPFQSVSNTTTQPSDPIVTDPQSRPSPLPQASTSIVRQLDLSITFNDTVGKELEIETVHVLSHDKRICCVKFSQAEKYLAAGCQDGKAYIYDVATATLTCVLRNPLAEHALIRAVCFSRDGKYLATGSGDGDLFIWEINTKYVRAAFKGHTRFIASLDFSPNGRLLVSASADSTVRLWNMRDGAAKFLTEDNPMILDSPCYLSAVFGPDGRCVAASHRDGMVRIWDVCTGQLMRRVLAHMDYVYGVVFTPDGKGLVSGCSDKTLKYWDISSLCTTRFHSRSQTTNDLHGQVSGVEEQTQPEREFFGHERGVFSLAISPDGRWVASGSSDQSVRIWDTRNATMQCVLGNDKQLVYSLDFSPTGRYLASGGRNGTVKIWRYSYTTDAET